MNHLYALLTPNHRCFQCCQNSACLHLFSTLGFGSGGACERAREQETESLVLTFWSCLEMRMIQVWCCNSSFYGQKVMSQHEWVQLNILWHTQTQCALPGHSPCFSCCCCRTKGRWFLLFYSQSPTPNEMNKTLDLKRKKFLTYVYFLPFLLFKL